MSIQSFIAERVFRPRAQSNRVLVVYDPQTIYLEIVRSMIREDCTVIVADGPLVDIRTEANKLLRLLASRPPQHAVIWLPFTPPRLHLAASHAQLQNDLAAVAVVLGPETIFPAGADDSLQAVCLKAFPDFHSRIHELFEGGRTPSFALINQLQQGQQWPELQAALGGTSRDALSSREIIEVFLERENLDALLPPGGPWLDEAYRILEMTLGISNLPRVSRAGEFRKMLWRTLLFSEFAFDASDDLPPALVGVPRASPAAKEFVYGICESRRGRQSQRDLYIHFANEVEAQLQLVQRAAGMRNLGERDTFAFEERLFLDRFCKAIQSGNAHEAGQMVDRRLNSMWIVQAECAGRMSEWQTAKAALELLALAENFVEPPRRLAQLAGAYQSNYHLLDRAHRVLEEAVGQRTEQHDGLDAVVELARSRYLDCAARLHAAHLRAIEVEGWPPPGADLENARLFDSVVDPLLRQNKRVAYLLIDSLRYELAVDLRESLLGTYPVELKLSYAQLPTYTEVGMASLMPHAKSKLALKVKDQGGVRKLAVFLGERAVPDPNSRFNHMREVMGDRCQHEAISRLQQGSRPHIDERVRLYVVRGSDIDEASHAGESRAMQQIPAMMREINLAIAKLSRMGFDHVVIATDHGFMLKPQHTAGDRVERPAGEWLVNKPRCLLGNGGSSSDMAQFIVDRSRLGIEGEFNQYATPRAFLAYDGTTGYFHDGLSPQENFLPCMVVTLVQTAGRARESAEVYLNNRGRDYVTVRNPSITLDWQHEELIARADQTFLVQAVDAQGAEVATLAMGENVDHVTQRVILQHGRPTRFGLVIREGFHGDFTVKALDPETLAEYHSLKLRTEFTY